MVELVERDHSSLLVAWDAQLDTASYELQMSSCAGEESAKDDEQWTTLSATLKTLSVKKKNLVAGTPYRFRVRAVHTDGSYGAWSAVSDAFYVLDSAVQAMAPPELVAHDGASVTLHWQDVPRAIGYHLRFREESRPAQWQTVGGLLSSCAAKKNGLDAHKNYFFAVLPVFAEGEEEPRFAYSLSAGPFKPASVSPSLAALFPATLRSKQSSSSKHVKTSDALAGKHVALYFSAHWCGPCRGFTPRLAELFQQVKAQHKAMEIVFVSADHDAQGFEEYYASMPWLAVDFEDDKREQLMAQFKVSGIPRLCVLAPSGRVIEDNAATRALTMRDVDQWLQQH